jgi:hypothetical protein
MGTNRVPAAGVWRDARPVLGARPLAELRRVAPAADLQQFEAHDVGQFVLQQPRLEREHGRPERGFEPAVGGGGSVHARKDSGKCLPGLKKRAPSYGNFRRERL